MMINGRPRGGMVPAPEAPPGVPLPAENWFEFQKRDHFNGRDYRWWKQVCVLRWVYKALHMLHDRCATCVTQYCVTTALCHTT